MSMTIKEALVQLKEDQGPKISPKAEKFIEYIKSKYPGSAISTDRDATDPHGIKVQIPYKSISPSIKPSGSGSLSFLEITIHPNDKWESTLGGIAIPNSPIFSKECLDKVYEIAHQLLLSKFRAIKESWYDFYQKSLQEGVEILIYRREPSLNIGFCFEVNDLVAEVSYFDYESSNPKVEIGVAPYSAFKGPDVYDLTGDSIDRYVNSFKEALSVSNRDKTVINFETFVKGLNLESLGVIHITPDMVKDNKLPTASPDYIDEQKIKIFSDFLLENFESELKTGDVKTILHKILNREVVLEPPPLPTMVTLSMLEPCIVDNFEFLYAFFLQELDVDILKCVDYDLKFLCPKQKPNRLDFEYAIKGKTIVVAKRLLEKNPGLQIFLGDIEALEIEEGVTSLEGISFTPHYRLSSSTAISLPTTLKGIIAKDQFEGSEYFYLLFKPVEVGGEKTSSFSVPSEEFKSRWGKHFIAQE